MRIALFALLLASCSSKPLPENDAKSSEIPEQKKTTETFVAPEPRNDLERYTADLGEGVLRATIETTLGALDCELFEEQAPFTVSNFVGLARGMKAWAEPESQLTVIDHPFYDGLIFHRVVNGFFAQTGDPLGTGEGGPGYVFPDEFHADLKHDKAGILSMAHRGANTNGSQFFVLTNPTPHLDNHHSVFGQCDSLDVVKKLDALPTDSADRPVDPPKIVSIKIYRK